MVVRGREIVMEIVVVLGESFVQRFWVNLFMLPFSLIEKKKLDGGGEKNTVFLSRIVDNPHII